MAKPERHEVESNAPRDPAPADLPPGVKLVRTLRGHTGTIGRIAWSPDGRILASPSHDKTIRLWDAETGDLLRTLRAHQADVFSVAFDPQARRLASGSDDKTVKVWDPLSGHLLHTIEEHEHDVTSVAFGPEGRTLASGSKDTTIKLWAPASGNLLDTLRGHRLWVIALAFDPQGRVLASGSVDHTVILWDPLSGVLLRTLREHRATVFCVAFDPEGGTLASGSGDKTIKLWDPARGKVVRSLEGHTGFVSCVAFSPDGRLLVSRGRDDSIRLWRSDIGALVATIREPASKSYGPGLAFHPRLPLLATVGSDPDTPEDDLQATVSLRDCVIHIWELDFAVLLRQAPAPTVSYTSAKIVLLGESMVGKSCLAMRIAEDRYPGDEEHGTTHGMKFWPMEPERLSPAAVAPEGQRRDVVLWDMGGQDEYRLVHQLFLHDTTVALVLVDPTRGRVALEEAEAWNKRLEKQLHGRPAKKLLVGAKLDQPCDTLDRQAIKDLCAACGFVEFYETSALTGRGTADLREAMAKAIDWEGLAQTSRPELFQRIRDEIDERRKRGEVVLHVADLHRALFGRAPSQEEARSVHAVAEQLAAQGVIARSRVATGEPVLVLQVHQIERYAGSLILAARNNARGVPALELAAITRPGFVLPGIAESDRLPRVQEGPVLECSVGVMLEHGICFQHEGLLVFPTLFAPARQADSAKLAHAVSLYYDFSGAIDNIYASLVAWLVLARDFGQVRLGPDQAEFEVADLGLCGLRKVGRPGGFAHLDVYFEPETPPGQRELFITFVEEHVRQHGVEIREHVAVTCTCGQELDEETLRKRIARGHKDVVCPVCDARHDLAQGAAESRQRNPQLAQWTWALKTEVDKRRQESTEKAIRVLVKAGKARPVTGPIRLLHLSDLHFGADTPVEAYVQWLADDLHRGECLGFDRLDYLVISGDFTDQGTAAGFERAYEFVSGLVGRFGLTAERCIFVPGNHDVRSTDDAFEWRTSAEGKPVQVQSEKYPLRLRPFSDDFYHKFLQKPYPTDYAEQGMAIPFWETGIQFLGLNSCWQVDQFNPKRAGVHPDAVARAVSEAQEQEASARRSGQLAAGAPLLRIAVWHHAVGGPEQMTNVDFLGNLQNNGVKIALHGDVHEVRRDLMRYWHASAMHVVGAGRFNVPGPDRPAPGPRLYNLLEITRDLKSGRVHTRWQPRPDGPWEGWNQWPRPDGGPGGVPYYDIPW